MIRGEWREALDGVAHRHGRATGTVNGTHKSKWGRHFCRPHSYQRVVAVTSHPVRQASPFAPLQRAWRAVSNAASGCAFPSAPLRVLPFLHRLASRLVTGARTGIRLYFVTAPLCSRPKPFPALTAPWQSRDRNPLVAGGSSTAVPHPKVLSYSYRHPALRS